MKCENNMPLLIENFEWLKISESSFSFWNNEEDAYYDEVEDE